MNFFIGFALNTLNSFPTWSDILEQFPHRTLITAHLTAPNNQQSHNKDQLWCFCWREQHDTAEHEARSAFVVMLFVPLLLRLASVLGANSQCWTKSMKTAGLRGWVTAKLEGGGERHDWIVHSHWVFFCLQGLGEIKDHKVKPRLQNICRRRCKNKTLRNCHCHV